MADNEDFTFEEESFLEAEALEDSPPGEIPLQHSESEKESSPVKQTSLLRILLLVVLLVVLGGVAFYRFIGVPEAQPPAPVVAQKNPINVPGPATTAAKEQPPATATAAASQPAAAAKPAVSLAPAKPETAKPAVAILPAKTLPTASSQTAPQPAVAPLRHSPAEPVTAATASGHFTLRSGAYLLTSSLLQVEKSVRKLGYEPVLTPVRRKVAMTRLKVGTYPPAEAAAKLASLGSAAPDSFVLTHDGQSTVYAGSYLILDQARRYADQLYSQGIRVEEEPAMVKETLQLVSFGDFADRKEAEAAAAMARATSLEATVVKRR